MRTRPNEHQHFGHTAACSIWVGTMMTGVCNCGAENERQMQVAREIMDEHEVALQALADRDKEYAEYEIQRCTPQPLQADDGGKEGTGQG